MVQRYQQHSEAHWTPTPMTVLREIDEMQRPPWHHLGLKKSFLINQAVSDGYGL